MKQMSRENKDNKLNYLSYLTPQVLERYAEHMKKGEKKRGRANWKKGYPLEESLESMMRHLLLLWEENEAGVKRSEEDHAAALMFNVINFMHQEWMDGEMDM